MAEEAAAPASQEPVDDAVGAAAGLRSTAQWIAGAFAGIPALAIVGALVEGPGEQGYDELLLALGVALAAAGALGGIFGFARVREPVGLTDGDISDGVLSRLPEARYGSFAALRVRLETERDLVGNRALLAADAAGEAAAAEAEAVQAEAAATLAGELVGDEPAQGAGAESVEEWRRRTREARDARREAREARAAAGSAAAVAAFEASDLGQSKAALDTLEGLRRAAYALQASAEVRRRYLWANGIAVAAVALVAAGVTLLALAPRPAAGDPAPQLVTLTLNDDGRAALGCEATEVEALRVGGTDAKPTVVVLPGGGCRLQRVEFLAETRKKLGAVGAAVAVPDAD